MFNTVIRKRNVFAEETHELYMSEMLGKKIYDNYGHSIGKVKDLVATWTDLGPEVTGIKFTHATEIIPIDRVKEWGMYGVFLHERPRLAMVRPIFDEEIFVNRWLLDKQIIDIRGAKVVRVNDIKLCWHMNPNEQMSVHLISVDIGVRGLFRRLGLTRFCNYFQEHLLDWQHFNPLQDRNASLQLQISREGLGDLHPADLADILEDLTQQDQTQFLRSLDPETAADTLAEVESETRSILLESMESQEAADLVQAMAPDEAADVLGELSRHKRSEILSRMHPDEAREMQELMEYGEGSAGALMTTEVVALSHHLTAQQAIEELRDIAPSADNIYYLYVIGEQDDLLGVLSLRELIIARPETLLGSITRPNPITLHPEDDYQKVLDVTVKYNLLAIPLVDEKTKKLLGIVTIDDVLDQLLEEKRKTIDKYSYLQSLRSFRS